MSIRDRKNKSKRENIFEKSEGKTKPVCHKRLEVERDCYFFTNSTMYTRGTKIKPSSLKRKLFQYTRPKNFKGIQASKN